MNHVFGPELRRQFFSVEGYAHRLHGAWKRLLDSFGKNSFAADNLFKARGVKPTLVHNHHKMKVQNHCSGAATSPWPALSLSHLQDAATEQHFIMATPKS